MKKDIDPEHNQGMEVVPQILTNQPDDFISIVNQLKQYGYDEVNLNLGCPSGTVVAKNRGAGFLAVPDQLDRFLQISTPHGDLPVCGRTQQTFPLLQWGYSFGWGIWAVTADISGNRKGHAWQRYFAGFGAGRRTSDGGGSVCG